MSLLKLTIKCLFSPRLERIYNRRPIAAVYHPFKMEQWSDRFIKWVITGYNLLVYTLPVVCFFAYRREYFSIENAPILARLGGLGCAIFSISLIARAFSRARNPSYVDFLRALNAPESQRVGLLRKFEFDFKKFPTTYVSTERIPVDPDIKKNVGLPWYRKSPVQILGIVSVHTFALRLIYPGAIRVITSLIRSELVRCRIQIVERYGGLRHKVRTADGNNIDCLFVDNRRGGTGSLAGDPNGTTLVICCEGNSGFYEMGIMATPLAGGFSTLGWNHPGFANSTGLPYPDQEQHAIDAVIQLSVNELQFPINRIVLYGWSIGGYPATWAAVRYPDIKCLVLDATFDDLLPLAEARMPKSWAPLVREVIRGHVDLHIGDLLLDYPGPVLLVRRLNDEIICLKEGELSTNRVNVLLVRLMWHRHTELMDNEQEHLLVSYLSLLPSGKIKMYQKVMKDGDEKTKKILTLVHNYMEDYNSTHCTPLPIDHFVIPSGGRVG